MTVQADTLADATMLGRVDIPRVQMKALTHGRHQEEGSRRLFVACGDASEMLELEEEGLDQIALAVECDVTMDLRLSCSGRDHCDATLFGDDITQRFCITALVVQDMLGGQAFDQSFGLRDVAGLPRREDKPRW